MRLPLKNLILWRGLPAALLVFVCILTICCVAHQASAEDYYVNNVVGDDRNNGSGPIIARGSGRNGPFRTIGRALEAAGVGDRIFIEKTDQAYRECVSIQGPKHNGTELQKFHIISNGAILDGTRFVNDRWEHVQGDVYRFRPEWKSHQQLFKNGLPIPQTRLKESSPPTELAPDQWTLRHGWIYFCTDGRLPTDYDLTYCYHTVGITLYQVKNVIIEGLVVQGFQLDGINAHDRATETTLVSNIVRGNARSGISVGGASRVNIIACLVGNNGDAQLRSEGYSQTHVQRCDIVDSQEFGPQLDNREGGKIILHED